jgi:hypothetical protein
MKKLVISALVLGALTSVAYAEPMQLSPAQMDGVTAGLRIENVNVAIFRVRQKNELFQSGGVVADDIQGRCDDCVIAVEANTWNEALQSNNVSFEQENED